MDGKEIIQSVKEAYFKVEDKYYDFLDQLNKKVPVYDVIDPIDKVVPSLLLFSGIILLLLILLFSFIAFPSQQTVLQVLDDKSEPIKGIEVFFELSGRASSQVTNNEGKIFLPGAGEAEISISVEGFQEFKETIFLIQGEVNQVFLQKKIAPPKTKTIVVRDSLNNPVENQEITVKFNCSENVQAPNDIHNFNSTIVVSEPGNCGVLSAKVIVSGFLEEEKSLVNDRTIFNLNPIAVEQPKTGSIIVSVQDEQGNPLPGIQLNLFESGLLFQEAFSSEAGNYFFEVPFGSYTATAFDLNGERRQAEQSNILIEFPAQQELVNLTLVSLKESEKRKLLIKVLDKDSKEGISARVDLYSNQKQLTSLTSLFDGLLEFDGVDSNQSYEALISHPLYVSKVVSPLKLVNEFELKPLEVLLSKVQLDENISVNSGEITAKVIDDENKEIQNASVTLLSETHPGIVFGQGASDKKGEINFKNLPKMQNYFLKAATTKASGESNKFNLNEKESKTIIVQLTTSTAKVKVKALNEQGLGEANAEVKVIDSVSEATLFEDITNQQGETRTENVLIDKNPFAVIRKDGFLPFYSKSNSLNKNESLTIEGILFSESTYSDLDVSLIEIQDSSGLNAGSLMPGNEYLLKFNLVLSQDADKAIVHVRAGDTPSLQGQEYFLVDKVDTPFTSAIKFSVLNQNPFSSDNASNTEQPKATNLIKSNPKKGVYELKVKLKVAENAADKSPVKIQFQARSETAGTIKETSLKTRNYSINSPIECISTAANPCPDFSFAFNLVDSLSNPIAFQNLQFNLIQSEGYKLSYTVRNQSNNDFRNLTLTVKDEDSALSLNELTESFSLNVGEEFSKDFTFSTEKEAFPARISFSLNDSQGTRKDVLLSVQPKKQLRIKLEPDKIYFNTENELIVRVKDNEGILVRGARVTASENSDYSNSLFSGLTNSEGFTSIFLNNPGSDKTYYFKAEKTFFLAGTLSRETTHHVVLAEAAERFKCVEFNLDNNRIEFQLGSSKNFSVKNNCEEDLQLRIVQENKESLNVKNLFNNQEMSDLQSTILLKGESKNFRVSQDIYAGQYELIIKVREEARTGSFIEIKKIPVYLTAKPGSCFSLNKTELELFEQQDTLQIINSEDCYEFKEELAHPKLIVSNGPSEVRFKLQVDESKKFEKELFFTPDGNRNEINEFISENEELIKIPQNTATCEGFYRSGAYDESVAFTVNYNCGARVLKDFAPNCGAPSGNQSIRNDNHSFAFQCGPYRSTYRDRWGNVKFRTFSAGVSWQCCEANTLPVKPDESKAARTGNEVCMEDFSGNCLFGLINGEGKSCENQFPKENSEVVCSDAAVYDVEINSGLIGAQACNQFIDPISGGTGGFSCLFAFDSTGKNYSCRAGLPSSTGFKAKCTSTKAESLNPNSVKLSANGDLACFNRGFSECLFKFTENQIGEISLKKCSDLNPLQVMCSNLKISEFNSKILINNLYNPLALIMQGKGIDLDSNQSIEISKIIESSDPVFVKFFDLLLTDNEQFNPTESTGYTGGNARHKIFLKASQLSDLKEIPKQIFNYLGNKLGAIINENQAGFIDSRAFILSLNPFSVLNDFPVWQGLASVCGGSPLCFNAIANNDYGYKIGKDASAFKVSLGGLTNSITKYFGAKISYKSSDADNGGVNDFTSTNFGFTGEEFALIEFEDNVKQAESGTGTLNEKFHVKIDAGKQNICYGRDNKEGITGLKAVPKIKLAWGFNDIELIEDEQGLNSIGSCDEANNEFIYCDSTQFTIELIKKLNEVQKLAEDSNYSARIPFLNFKAYLMKDGFSEDFHKDFDDYFTKQSFFEAPDYYTNRFTKIVKDPQRLLFTSPGSPENDLRAKVTPVPEPGLYRVNVSIELDDPNTQSLFKGASDEPNAKVTVVLVKERTAPDLNPFYFMPFDLSLGIDEQGNLNRVGYGRKYTGTVLTVSGDPTGNRVATLASAGNALGELKINSVEDFKVLNKDLRGSVLTAKNNELNLMPSNASPVLMKVESKTGKASSAYYLQDSSGNKIVLDNYLSLWSGVGSTLGNDFCQDFESKLLPLEQGDKKLSTFTQNLRCPLRPDISAEEAYSFTFTAPENSEGEKIFLSTVFYTPLSKSISLINACSGLKSSVAGEPFFIGSDGSVIAQGAESIALNNSVPGKRLDVLSNVFDLIKRQYLCIDSKADEVDIWWNEKELLESLKEVYPSTSIESFQCLSQSGLRTE